MRVITRLGLWLWLWVRERGVSQVATERGLEKDGFFSSIFLGFFLVFFWRVYTLLSRHICDEAIAIEIDFFFEKKWKIFVDPLQYSPERKPDWR